MILLKLKCEVDIKRCHLAKNLTVEPRIAHKSKHIEPLKKLGLGNRAILEATLVVAYFNFLNRIVLGLGIKLEKDGRDDGYTFD